MDSTDGSLASSAAQRSRPAEAKRKSASSDGVEVAWRTYAYAGLAGLGELGNGYDVGAFSFAILFIQILMYVQTIEQDDPSISISLNQITILVAMLNIVSALGCIISGPISDAFGRKVSLILGNLIAAAGSLLLAVSYSFEAMFAARAIMGIGSGIAFMAPELYCSEMSPPSVRGFTATLAELSINGGILLGYLGGWALAPDWRWIVGVGAFIPVVSAASQLWIPESPRWLVKVGREAEALQVIGSTANYSRAALDAQIDEIKREVEAEKAEGGSALHEYLCPKPALVLSMAAGWGAAFLQQATGSEALLYYTPTLLGLGGITDTSTLYLVTACMGAVKTSVVMVAWVTMDVVGRRPLLLASSAGLCASLVALAVAYAVNPFQPALAFSALFSCMFSFSIGWGPLAGVILSEVFPLRFRGSAVGIGWAANRITSGLVTYVFLLWSYALGVSGTFALFGGVALFATVYVWFLIPETKGLSLEQITHLLEKKAGTPTTDPHKKEVT